MDLKDDMVRGSVCSTIVGRHSTTYITSTNTCLRNVNQNIVWILQFWLGPLFKSHILNVS